MIDPVEKRAETDEALWMLLPYFVRMQILICWLLLADVPAARDDIQNKGRGRGNARRNL